MGSSVAMSCRFPEQTSDVVAVPGTRNGTHAGRQGLALGDLEASDLSDLPLLGLDRIVHCAGMPVATRRHGSIYSPRTEE
jgi:hypothetical protein